LKAVKTYRVVFHPLSVRPWRSRRVARKTELAFGVSQGLSNFPVFLVNKIYLKYTKMTQTIPPITLPPSENPLQEGEWLQQNLLNWLDKEFIPEAINQNIAKRASQIFVRQRMEGENDLGSLVIAIITEMQSFDFSKSFFGEFAIANAVSDLLLDSLGIDHCCGQ
jgi:hypothetical protein